MNQIPSPAKLLGFAGAMPFIWAAISSLTPLALPIARFNGAELAISYGIVILCFMSGVLWGFATRGGGFLPYALSVIPALFVLFAVGWGTFPDLMMLGFGFIAILVLDRWFMTRGLAPNWWLALRLRITAIVLPSLVLVAIGG